ncbi:DUF4382 domain-containing protein [Sphingobacterium lactis]|uniref:DUF4382 domain-containing protein n=1 Tax=Sphingobacterium lactis TaxID=797291 RepID=A0A1H5YNG2_9SPHI|nr:DUF4382 domain-containing protein [Sphingobacterium lactis]SEG25544.1 protein of unknown function [Sphingobacterium lactis]
MKAFLGFTAVAAALALASCSTDSTGTSGGTTPFTLKMTDAPGFYDAINLNLDAVEIITEGGREVIDIDDNLPFDILKFRLGRDTVLASHDVPSGRLQEIRLILDDEGNDVWIDGQRHDLTTPSGQSSGVKIKVQDDLIPNMAYTLLLDFDASRSIHTTGNGKYMLKPVIRAIPVAVSGVVKGIVTPIAAEPHVYAIHGQDTIAGTMSTTMGEFYFPGIPQGDYTISVVPTNPAFLTKNVDVTVTTGQTKDLGTITLEAK